jgi:hypothetical protein
MGVTAKKTEEEEEEEEDANEEGDDDEGEEDVVDAVTEKNSGVDTAAFEAVATSTTSKIKNTKTITFKPGRVPVPNKSSPTGLDAVAAGTKLFPYKTNQNQHLSTNIVL